MRRAYRLAVAGAALALGAPAGWLFARCLQGAPAGAELRAHAGLYGYLLAGTVVAFSTFGAVCGMLLDRLAGANEELRKLSSTDALTGLANLRQFRDRLALETARARRLDEPLALIAIDLDRFKQLNDRLGHDIGDSALVHAAAVLRTSIREVDLACRIGGDEFAVICPGATEAGAAAVAERARSALENTPFRAPGGESVSLTASLGVSMLAAGERQLFQATDHALYAAKASGRNRVCLG
jgi:diguanylate cyclase (GGDEF)-like protein